MGAPRIVAVATATPPHRFDQATLLRIAGYDDTLRAGFFRLAAEDELRVVDDVLVDRRARCDQNRHAGALPPSCPPERCHVT